MPRDSEMNRLPDSHQPSPERGRLRPTALDPACPPARSRADRGSRRRPRRPCRGRAGRAGSRPRSRSRRRGATSARRRAGRSGRAATARAIATRARSPCESRATRCVARSASPTDSSASSAASGSPRAAQRERELDVLERGEVRHEPGLLADVGDLLAAERGAAGAVERASARRRRRRPSPASGSSSPASRCSSVVLPEPDGPVDGMQPARLQLERRGRRARCVSP